MIRLSQTVVGAVLPRLALMLGVLAMLSSAARADLWVDHLGLYNGGASSFDPNTTFVEIKFTGNTGEWTSGDAQTATNFTSGGAPIPLYCIDLNHDNTMGSSYQLTSWTNPNSFSSDTLNKVAWTMENAGAAGYGPAAAQLLIWSLLDSNFAVINWNGETLLHTAYTHLSNALNAQYNSGTNYMGNTEFYDAIHQPHPNMNQDLAFATPEPSTVAIAGLGALGLIGYRWRSRVRARTQL